MAISVSTATYVIYVPQDYLTDLGDSIYKLDVDAFRLDLKDWEDSEDGMSELKTHNHNTQVTLSGVPYARIVEIVSPYTVEFENGYYSVLCTGANHNILDVKVVNSVSLIIGNSAGLVEIDTGSGLTSNQSAQLNELYASRGIKSGSPMEVSAEEMTFDGVTLKIERDVPEPGITRVSRQ